MQESLDRLLSQAQPKGIILMYNISLLRRRDNTSFYRAVTVVVTVSVSVSVCVSVTVTVSTNVTVTDPCPCPATWTALAKVTGITVTPGGLDVAVVDDPSLSGNGDPVVSVVGRGCSDALLFGSMLVVVTSPAGDPDPLIVPSPGVMVVYPPTGPEKVGCMVTKTTVSSGTAADVLDVDVDVDVGCCCCSSVAELEAVFVAAVSLGEAAVTSAVTLTVAKIVVCTCTVVVEVVSGCDCDAASVTGAGTGTVSMAVPVPTAEDSFVASWSLVVVVVLVAPVVLVATIVVNAAVIDVAPKPVLFTPVIVVVVVATPAGTLVDVEVEFPAFESEG